MSFLSRLFPSTPAETAAAAEVAIPEATTAVAGRYSGLLAKARVKGLDPNTLLLLLQFFGPLFAELLKRLIDRI